MIETNSNLTSQDLHYLERSLELAEGGRGFTSPNPIVGAVVVKDGVVLGEGYHAAYGQAHAEIMAFADLQSQDLKGATLYVSLEPCSHHGKTPPCTAAIIANGIKRVVVAAEDPSEKVSGKGIRALLNHGVEISIAQGAVAARARTQNQVFRKYSMTRVPFVHLKWAMSLDGKVATKTGDSKWISSEASRALVHKWRAYCDAVAVGKGTVLHDDPLLTARIDTSARVDTARVDTTVGIDTPARVDTTAVDAIRQPRRVVFDSKAQLPLSSALVRTLEQSPVLVIVSPSADKTDVKKLERAGVEVIVAEGDTHSRQVVNALVHLGVEGITSILLEGGPRLAGAFLDAGAVDQISVFLAPILIGSDARQPIQSTGVSCIKEAIRAVTLESQNIGEDVLLRAKLKDW